MEMEDREIVVLESEYDRLKMENYQLKDELYALKDEVFRFKEEVFKVKEEKYALNEQLQQALHELEMLKQGTGAGNMGLSRGDGTMLRRAPIGRVGAGAETASIRPRRRPGLDVNTDGAYDDEAQVMEQSSRSVRRPPLAGRASTSNGQVGKPGLAPKRIPLAGGSAAVVEETGEQMDDYVREKEAEAKDIHQVVRRASATSRDGRVRRPPGPSGL